MQINLIIKLENEQFDVINRLAQKELKSVEDMCSEAIADWINVQREEVYKEKTEEVLN